MKAKEFLKQVEKWDKMIDNKLIEQKQWKDIACNTTAGSKSILINGEQHSMDRVQTSGNQQKMADAIVKYVDIEKEINQCINELYEAKKAVLDVIEQLNADEYDILHKVYIRHLPLWDAAEASNKSYTWAKSVHGRALQKVQQILDETAATELTRN